jgi:hypothetical protein
MKEFEALGLEMPRFTMAVSTVMVVLGVIFYVLTAMKSMTALIPAFLAVPLFAMGLLSQRMPDKKKIWMHIAVLLGVVCITAGTSDFPALLRDGLTNDSGGFAYARLERLLTSVIGFIYTYFCVQSFRHARRNR